MEQFDISYRLLIPGSAGETSLIAQMVPGDRGGEFAKEWTSSPSAGRIERKWVCRFVDAKSGQAATPEGIIYRLIVRLHRWSLGRADFHKSLHWQRGW
jgi:hypothetical protein